MERPLTIIIAEDDTDDHFLIQQAIKECDRNIITDSVYNGSQLLDTLLKGGIYSRMRDVNPDIIFTDLEMPFSNGFEMIKTVRSNSKFDNIPIYVFTSALTDEIKFKLLALGAKGTYQKPHTFMDLKKLVRSILESEGLSVTHVKVAFFVVIPDTLTSSTNTAGSVYLPSG